MDHAAWAVSRFRRHVRRADVRQVRGFFRHVHRSAGLADGFRRGGSGGPRRLPGAATQNLAAILREPFLAAKDEPAKLIDELVQLAEIARKDGLLALETIAPEIRNPFIALGVQLAVDGNRPETVREIMQNEVAKLAARAGRRERSLNWSAAAARTSA